MKRLMLMAAIAVLMSGCATPRQTMVDPKTGITQDCAALGIGLIGVPVAFEMRRACVAELKKAGMVDLESYQKSGGRIAPGPAPASVLKIESDPPGADIYSGMSESDVTTRLGTTPYILANPTGGRMWARECFKMAMDGYFDTTVECFEPVFGDRAIKMNLAKK